MSIEPEDKDLIKHAEDASQVVPFVQFFRDLADDVDSWWADGVPEREVDRRILDGVKELGWDTAKFAEGIPMFDAMSEEQRANILKALRFDEWTIECVKSIARTDKPLPFIYAIGDVFVDDKSMGNEGVLVWAVATEATNPEVVAKKFVRKCKEVFGNQVTKDIKPRVMRPGQYTPAESYAKHVHEKMSYRDIAIQNLRRTHPDIITRPHKYKRQIKDEKERVRDEILRFAALWGNRLSDSPTPK